jgi:phosphoglycerate kinase
MTAPSDKSAKPITAAALGAEGAGRAGPLERRPGNVRTVDDLIGQHLRVFLRADAYVLYEPAAAAEPDAAAAPEPAPVAAAAPAPESAPSEIEVPLGATDVVTVAAEAVEARPAPAAPPSSLRRLLELGARVFVGTELSRAFSLETGIASLEELATHLSERLGADVLMPEELVGDSLAKVAQDLRPGQICLLPDLARAEADVQNAESLARRLASYIDAYVGDAFSVCHLPDRGFLRLPRLVPQRALGYRMQHELERLSELGQPGSSPLVLVVGGERFSDKAALLNQWVPRASAIAFGGGVANTVLAALGHDVGQSTCEPERLAEARSFVARARALGVELIVPVDVAVRTASGAWVKGSLVQAARPDEVEPATVVPVARVGAEQIITELGPESVRRVCEAAGKARSVLWWGPLGVSSARGYADSTLALSEALGRAAALSVALGSELRRSLLALPDGARGLGLISTGSSAAQALLGGRRLPGAEVLGDP